MKKKNSFVITGITSLFLIFSVLCLIILSLLSLGTSRSDLTMSKHTMEQTGNYYEACTRASELCLQAEAVLWETFIQSADENDFYANISINSFTEFTWNTLNKQFNLEIPFSDSQALFIILDVIYPATDDDTILQIDTWKTIVTGTWNPDNKQHIYQGE